MGGILTWYSNDGRMVMDSKSTWYCNNVSRMVIWKLNQQGTVTIVEWLYGK